MAEQQEEFDFVDVEPVAAVGVVEEVEDDDAESLVAVFEDDDTEKNPLVDLEQDVRAQLSELQQERLEMHKLKKELQANIATYKKLCSDTRKIGKQLKTRTTQLDELKVQMESELKTVMDMKDELTTLKTDLDGKHKTIETDMKVMTDTKLEHETMMEDIKTQMDAISKQQVELASIAKKQQKAAVAVKAKEDIEAGRSSATSPTTITTGEEDDEIRFTGGDVYCCKDCGTEIAYECDVESRCYQVGQGTFSEKKRGYLFTTATGLVMGKIKKETFTTGQYSISWVKCSKCSINMGWKYLDADTPNNKTKVGKFCLSRYNLTNKQERSDRTTSTTV